MRLGEAIFLGIVTGAALAIAWEIWGEVIRQHADTRPGATVPAPEGAAATSPGMSRAGYGPRATDMGLTAGNPVVGGTVLERAAIRSPDFVTGVSGWTINQDGSVEFNSAACSAARSPPGSFRA